MTTFSRKPISSIEPLGVRLRHAREESGMSVETLALQTGIPCKYLAALESSRYDELPGDVYVKNFLRICGGMFHFNNERVLEMYDQERRIAGSRAVPAPPTALPNPRVINAPRLLRNAGLVLGVAALLLYLGLKVQGILEPPALTVAAPAADLETTERTLTIEGSTEPESSVRINGQEAFLGTDGRFSERIDLQLGLNVIKITSQKERSREQTAYRRVIVKEPPLDTPSQQTPVLGIGDLEAR
ncbi:MAG: helix-turn-helix domain-containing protein [Candidatus Kerfeldbacteria bacterium]|nr:helix-turn-helix domain-containing protein [Candidatus Kerfeldbacteria bacterium]